MADAATQTQEPASSNDILPVAEVERFNLWVALPLTCRMALIMIRIGFHEMVTVEVGPQKTIFKLHKAMCVKHSYFAKAFNGYFIENGGQRLVLKGDSPEAFNLVAENLYTGTVAKEDEGEFINELLEERVKSDPKLHRLMSAREVSALEATDEENKKFQTYYDDATAVIAKRPSYTSMPG